MHYILNYICYAQHLYIIFSFTMTMISNLTKFFLSNIYFRIFLYKYNRYLHCLVVPGSFFKLIIFIVSSLKDLQNFFMQSLPLYTSCLFSMLLNDDIVEIEKSWWNMFTYLCCSLIFGIIFASINLSIINSRAA